MSNLNILKQYDIKETSCVTEAKKSVVETLWLGIYFPQISLLAHQSPRDEPFAVLEMQRGRPCIHIPNQAAQRQGIEAGMALQAAYSLCHELGTVLRDEARERVCLQRYARTALAFTPHISLAQADTLLLEVRASLRLFGGLGPLYRQLKRTFDIPHTIAGAPTAEAAELLARQGIEKRVRNRARLVSALGGLGLPATPLERDLLEQLARCGLHNLRDLWRLPRSDLARRFGPGLLHYLDRLSGQENTPRLLFMPEEGFSARYEFEQETNKRDELLYVAERLLRQAQDFLQLRASLSEQLQFNFFYAHYHDSEQRGVTLDVRAQQGGDSVAHFLPLLEERLQAAVFSCPLSGLELRIRHYRPRADTTRDLFKRGQAATGSWSALLDLLLARLGGRRVYHLATVADHRPEKAWCKAPPAATGLRRPVPVHSPVRPVWLFRQPVKCLGRRFRLVSDAERLEAGWWEGQDMRREYYQGIAPSGRHCWLYRNLQANCEEWYMHGLFA